jgi:hypothetical protein
MHHHFRLNKLFFFSLSPSPFISLSFLLRPRLNRLSLPLDKVRFDIRSVIALLNELECCIGGECVWICGAPGGGASGGGPTGGTQYFVSRMLRGINSLASRHRHGEPLTSDKLKVDLVIELGDQVLQDEAVWRSVPDRQFHLVQALSDL